MNVRLVEDNNLINLDINIKKYEKNNFYNNPYFRIYFRSS